ncbi:DUF3375 family protein [Paenarthrobacter ureafaciens]|uniref:DUF3375 family protein n=1 Tax=Paenarthrobacter ureafaciens TaxID=37931 RepID=UPI001FB290F2|nr:DUF3375 family protein [Paenarthrobacter ureafaciens]UOD80955.1 DUF3375 domain-containing protein [Paenarthrobacter ureafaciens]WNZ03614.1 DUF3375 family protein [Paenarthrobacter ureafaciens]
MSRSAMSSADAISARLRDLEQLTKGPAWTLTRSAPWVIAVLQASFTRTRPQLPLEEFHADVDAFLEQLRRQDPALGGQLNGKAFGDEWTRKQFLTRRNQSGQIVYEVTEAAARVLAFLDSLSSERSTLNGSRLGTLLGDVEKLANETNPDQSARLEALEEEIQERQQLVEDISSGEFDGLLDDEEAVEAAGNILDLAASLPADYKKMRDRIEELVGELRNQIIEESLSKGATMAQVLEADKRLRQSPEGRTFRSFTAFLEDPQQQMRFRSAIGEVLSRQFADDLTHEDRETLKNLVAELRTQHSEIQRIYGKLSESLNTYIQSDDVRQSVTLRKVLAEAEQAIRSMPYERDRPGLVPGPVLYNAGFESLALVKLFDPDEFATPPRLADPIAFTDSDRVKSARTGKARPDVVRAAMAGSATLGEAWENLPAEERHINTVRSLLSMALQTGAAFDRAAWEHIDFEQIDGSIRTAYLPVVTLNEDSYD